MPTTQDQREAELLSIERAGGLCMGTGLGNGFDITHTIGKSGEGEYGSFVVITAKDTAGREVSVVFDPTWSGVGEQLINSIRYHCNEAANLRAERQQIENRHQF
jgi:hypothetical protein